MRGPRGAGTFGRSAVSTQHEEAVMTDPRVSRLRGKGTDAEADWERALKPEVKPEVLTDLDVTGEDADVIRGGPCNKSYVQQ